VLNDLLVNNELERVWKEAIMPDLGTIVECA
jgi:hypothetical protein